MKKIAILCMALGCVNCATESEPVSVTDKQAAVLKEQSLPPLETLKIDMPRIEVEKLLGEPMSITDTATGSTLIWVFGEGAIPKALEKTSSDTGLLSKIGGIAAMTLGIFSPIAGTATSLGTQIYGAASSENETAPAQTSNAFDAMVVTIEFRDNKAFSIQRTKSSSLPTVGQQR